ncbi:MAG: hypothetical protein V2I36_08085 [Desulfopila sp.]|jgi:hypothetical protein|nr:hypothetical protein [Desulfopila sp.]
MKDASNLHLKVQELCDCFATTDPLKEMSEVKSSPEAEEAALKWIALAVLHGINNNAEKIALTTDEKGKVEVLATYRKTELPSPGTEIGRKIIEKMREITHMEKEKEKISLALGFRNNDLDLKVKSSKKDGKETLKIYFP